MSRRAGNLECERRKCPNRGQNIRYTDQSKRNDSELQKPGNQYGKYLILHVHNEEHFKLTNNLRQFTNLCSLKRDSSPENSLIIYSPLADGGIFFLIFSVVLLNLKN